MPDASSVPVPLPVRLTPPPLADSVEPVDPVPVPDAHADVVPDGAVVVTEPELVPPALTPLVVDGLTVVLPSVALFVSDPPAVVPPDVALLVVPLDVDPLVVVPAEVVPPALVTVADADAGPLTLAPTLELPDGAVTLAVVPPADALVPLVAADAPAEPPALAFSSVVTAVLEPSVLALNESLVFAVPVVSSEALVPPADAFAAPDAVALVAALPDVATAASATDANASIPAAARAAAQNNRDLRMTDLLVA